QALRLWLQDELGFSDYGLEPASSDASFRRYFRIQRAGRSYIAMDAPPEREDCRPFIQVTRLLFDLGLNVPQLLELDPAQGFLLLGDLGDRLYLQALNEQTVERLYGDALAALAVMQACGPNDGRLPPYDRELLLREMALFPEWLLQTHLDLALDQERERLLEKTFALLADNALQQPQVFVHRDYHSRNLMVTAVNNPGILDYQDAVVGPVTYDLVSLLRDCYIQWPRARVEDWALGYRELAQQSGILREDVGEARFLRWFDRMGVQRHLKAAGIFARLNHRDGKPGYLADIPRTLGYIVEVAEHDTELGFLGELIRERVLPRL
ncbi:MAG: phosphotransferase, partial [Xanthomonadaceae bacterium]|nr:phosphotransferase [Xanthomonadaceae bacterium]